MAKLLTFLLSSNRTIKNLLSRGKKRKGVQGETPHINLCQGARAPFYVFSFSVVEIVSVGTFLLPQSKTPQKLRTVHRSDMWSMSSSKRISRSALTLIVVLVQLLTSSHLACTVVDSCQSSHYDLWIATKGPTSGSRAVLQAGQRTLGPLRHARLDWRDWLLRD